MKNIICFFIMLCLTGCNKPYSMLDDRAKIQRTFEQYINQLDERKYDEAYELLYFGHIPEGGNKKLFVSAQDTMNQICSNIDYQGSLPIVKNNLAVMDLDMIFNYSNGNRSKTVTQVCFVNTANGWKIAIGDFVHRMKLLTVYPEFSGFSLKPDKSFRFENDQWVEIQKNVPAPADITTETIIQDTAENLIQDN